MNLHDLKPAAGSTHRRKRVGRGEGSGIGKTSGRGMKGQKARNTIRPGFEGGRTSLARRQPHLPGFTPRNRVEFAVVNVGQLDALFEAGAVVDPAELKRRGIVRRPMPIKVLGRGDISKALTIRAAAFSDSARDKIGRAGGKAEVVSARDGGGAGA